MARWRDVKKGKVEKKEEKKRIHYAKITDRLKAFLTDTFMITMPIIYIVIYLIMGDREAFKEHMAQGWLYIIIPHFIIVTLLWTIKGQTPGMKAYNIKVVKYKDLTNINFLQAVIRYIFLPISIISVVGLLIAFFREDRATLADLISFSKVIEIEDI
jgi:uncharacterized RDD family membrane protein YckC